MPPVAVLLAMYGGDDPRLVKRAILSMVGQSYGGEVRIYLGVDGPISLDLEDVVGDLSSAIYLAVRSEVRQGLAKTLNSLIDTLGDEPYVFRMDADDWSYPDRVVKQIDFLLRNPHIHVLGGSIREVNEERVELRIRTYPSSPKEVVASIAYRSPLAHPAVCMRREAIERFRHYPDYAVAQDVALWFKCIGIGLHICSIEDVVLDFTVGKVFYERRRSFGRAWIELKVWIVGIWDIHGISWRYIFPMMRFAVRMLPADLVKVLYRSNVRP